MFTYATDKTYLVKSFASLVAAVHHGIAQGLAFSVSLPSGAVAVTWEPGREARWY